MCSSAPTCLLAYGWWVIALYKSNQVCWSSWCWNIFILGEFRLDKYWPMSFILIENTFLSFQRHKCWRCSFILYSFYHFMELYQYWDMCNKNKFWKWNISVFRTNWFKIAFFEIESFHNNISLLFQTIYKYISCVQEDEECFVK